MQGSPLNVGVMLLDCLESRGVEVDALGVAAGVAVGGGRPAMVCVLAANVVCTAGHLSFTLRTAVSW